MISQRGIAATKNASTVGFEGFIAAFRRLARRAIRPVVLRSGSQVNEHFEAASAAFFVAPGKAVENGLNILMADLTSRKTAGLMALRASRVNAAGNFGRKFLGQKSKQLLVCFIRSLSDRLQAPEQFQR